MATSTIHPDIAAPRLSHLQLLEAESIHIFREVVSEFQNPVMLYAPPAWTQYVTAALMLPVFPLFLAAYFPGRIRGALQHPMLVSVMLWALAHLIATGMLANVVLFGGFFAWAVADRISFRWRTPRPIPTAPSMKLNDGIAIVAGLVVYVVFEHWLHVRLIGVQPLPM